MAVVDIKSAYRAVPIFPDHRRYLRLKWKINGETVFIETPDCALAGASGQVISTKYRVLCTIFWQICIIFRQ